jgi:hypothetical protein
MGRPLAALRGSVRGLIVGTLLGWGVPLSSIASELTLGVGGFTQNLFKSVSVSETSETSGSGSPFVAVVAAASFPTQWFSSSQALQFQLGFTPLGISGSDGDFSRRILWVSTLWEHRWSAVEVHGGVSALMTLYSSTRGSVSLNNGNATTRYYIPSSGETTRLLALQAGASWPVVEWLKFGADFFLSGFASDRRSAALQVSLGVPLWL